MMQVAPEEDDDGLDFIDGNSELGGSLRSPTATPTTTPPSFGAGTTSTQVEEDDGISLANFTLEGAIRKSRHPGVMFFHLIFKTAALVVYIFAGMFSDDYTVVFVLVILLLAFDFWTVKNISGRLLVGLRWWNYVKEDGSNKWVFESLEDMSCIGKTDKIVFWYSTYGTLLAWAVLFVIGFVKLNLEYLVIVCVALSMNGAQLVGFVKCSRDAKKKFSNMAAGVAGKALASAASAFVYAPVQ